MEIFYLSFTVVFPLVCMMSLGYVLRVVGIFNELFLKQLNKLCFKVFLPTLLFTNLYQSSFEFGSAIPMIVFGTTSVLIIFFLLVWIVPRFVTENRDRGVMIQGIFRSNFVLFGIPMIISLFGTEKTGVAVIMIALVVPLFNVLSVIILEIYSGHKTNFLSIIQGVAKNPLLIASVLGFVFLGLGIKIPLLMQDVLLDISQVTTPLALIALGGEFQFSGVAKYKKLLSGAILGKLVLVPLFGITSAVLLGFRGIELAVLMAMFVSPTAVSSFTMAQSVGANDELAGQIVVWNSILAIVSIFIWVTILQYAHML
ncbi:AEC family transporter [Chakrabartyella piscis]|uniref:AEC family transporter n=1 Tax=Chakrabartyella piscis TaxID=2918914 RepID=UPI002958C3D9|nr:AEC family transporter [Chakrabartyella piscis]